MPKPKCLKTLTSTSHTKMPADTLHEKTTVRWRGLLVPTELGGESHQVHPPGRPMRAVLPIGQPAATHFYRSHAHGRTVEQVYAGLAGLLLVSDDEQQALKLPSEYGVDDLALVLQDLQFEDGRLVLPDGMTAVMMGRGGDTILANGTANARAGPRRADDDGHTNAPAKLCVGPLWRQQAGACPEV